MTDERNDSQQPQQGEDIEALRKELEEVRAEAAKRRKALRELEQRLKAYEGVDPEEYRQLKERFAQLEEERLKKQGEFEELLKRKQSEWQKRLSELEQAAKTWEQKYRQVAIEERLVSAFAKAGAIAPEEAAALTRQLVDIDDEGVYVRGEDGTPLTRDGKRISLEDFARQWLEEHPHHLRAGAGGAGSQGGRGEGSAKTMRRADWEKLPPMDRARFIREGGRLID